MTDPNHEDRSFDKIIDYAPTGFCTVGMDGRFIRVNPYLCEMLGYSIEELAKLKFTEITHPGDIYRDGEAFEAMLRGERDIYHTEKRYICKSGKTIWTDLTTSLVRNEKNQPKYFVSVLQNVTRRKEAETALSASERRFKTLFQQAPFSAQLLGLDGRTLQVNAAWEQLWQTPKETIENYVLKEYNVLSDPQLAAKGITPYIKAAYAGESVITDPILYDPKEIGQMGRARWLAAFIHPIKDDFDNVVEVMLIHHDITDRMQAMEELKTAKEAAESANYLKSAFLATMSHEIRTPLAAILGFTELLKQNDLSKKDRLRYLDIIERSGHSLTQVINDILDLSRVETGNLRVEKGTIRVRDLLEESLNLLQIEAKKKDLSLSLVIEPEAPEFIETDPVRLKQIIINLVGNALKFTFKGGVIITVKKQDRDLTIAVQDSGIGIPDGDQSWLFQPFRQLDESSTRKFGGTGLGLALSRRLANALGGDIQLAESIVGRGSLFVISLPGDASTSKFSTPSQDTKVGSLGGVKVLVVDDSEDNRFLIEQILTRRNAMVAEATNGIEAIEKIARTQFDVVLMDIQMPVLDGLEATRRIRSGGGRIPIIALTANAMKEDLQKSIEAGCNAHVSKPLTADALIRAIIGQVKKGPAA